MNGANLNKTMNRELALAVAMRVSRDPSGYLHKSKVGDVFRICSSCNTAKMAAINRARSDHPNCSDFTPAKERGKQAAVLTHCIKAGSLSLVRYFVDPHLKHPDLFNTHVYFCAQKDALLRAAATGKYCSADTPKAIKTGQVD